MVSKKTSLITALVITWLIMALTASVACAGDASNTARIQGKEKYSDIAAVVDRYISALQNGDAEELRIIFLPEASYYFFREGRLVGGEIDILYKTVDRSPIPKPIVYDVTSIQVSGRIASVTLDIQDIMGVRIIDMFTLVQDDNNVWRLASKVARRPN